MRRRLAQAMRRWADRIDHAGAPKAINWSFTFERERGLVFHEGGHRGCRLWYLGDDEYKKAHSEAETEHMIVDWKAMKARFGR